MFETAIAACPAQDIHGLTNRSNTQMDRFFPKNDLHSPWYVLSEKIIAQTYLQMQQKNSHFAVNAMQDRDPAMFGRQLHLQNCDPTTRNRNIYLQNGDSAMRDRDIYLQNRDFATRNRDFAIQSRNSAVQNRNIRLLNRNSAMQNRHFLAKNGRFTPIIHYSVFAVHCFQSVFMGFQPSETVKYL